MRATTQQQAEVWILGAIGRIGRALVGCDPGRLAEVAAGLGRLGRTVVAASPSAIADEIQRQRPAIVVNLLGG